ncbi:MAG: WG repeat-containing protein [Paludibacter sp.]|nr:WG repeat-containing protein [Paludibacter sp.]
MKKIILLCIVLFPIASFAQTDNLFSKEPSDEPFIHYYHFYNGVQMIQLDYRSAYERKVRFLESTQPRALEWRNVLGGSKSNVYIFRNKNGEIVKQFGNTDMSKLLSVEESLKISEPHLSLRALVGTRIGYSNVTTSHFPYYLISEQQSLSSREGLIDSLGNVVLPTEYNEIWKGDNLFITRKDGYNELRDVQLNIKFRSMEYRLQPSQFLRESVSIFKDGENSNQYTVGLMNSEGKIIIPCKYDMLIDGFNKFGLAKVRGNHRYGFVDTTGKEIIECKYQSVGEFKEGLLQVRLNDKWGFVDTKGKTIIKHQFEGVHGFSDDLALVTKREGFDLYYHGFIDKSGNLVIPFKYTAAQDFKDGLAKVKLNQLPGVLLQMKIRRKDL